MGGAGIKQMEHTADCFGGAWLKSPLSTAGPMHPANNRQVRSVAIIKHSDYIRTKLV